METTFINGFFSGTQNPVQSAAMGAKGKETDPDMFFTMLKGTIDCSQSDKAQETGGSGKGGVEDKNRKGGTSADALSKSLDIIDALAFLPILLTMKPRVNSDTGDQQQTQTQPDSLNSFLSAITTALQTGNMEEIKKVLEGNETLKGLFSGEKKNPVYSTSV
ncbi:MAG: hypothetical protein C0392_01845, partial [Syntrophus sp. (in: bacteria)]|nr:hypothetical protein [Syntrophus sp. (in: bacteria)]